MHMFALLYFALFYFALLYSNFTLLTAFNLEHASSAPPLRFMSCSLVRTLRLCCGVVHICRPVVVQQAWPADVTLLIVVDF